MKQTEWYKTSIRIMTVLILMASVYFIAYQRTEEASSGRIVNEKEKPCVVIDAGHGGSRLR